MSDCTTTKIIKKSRKKHKCEHCWQEIPKGVSYTFSSGIFDNSPFAMKAHNECHKEYINHNQGSDNYEWFPLEECMDGFCHHQEYIKRTYKLLSNNQSDDGRK